MVHIVITVHYIPQGIYISNELHLYISNENYLRFQMCSFWISIECLTSLIYIGKIARPNDLLRAFKLEIPSKLWTQASLEQMWTNDVDVILEQGNKTNAKWRYHLWNFTSSIDLVLKYNVVALKYQILVFLARKWQTKKR